MFILMIIKEYIIIWIYIYIIMIIIIFKFLLCLAKKNFPIEGVDGYYYFEFFKKELKLEKNCIII